MMYSYPYTYFDQYRIIEGELYMNFALCLVAVSLICIFVIGTPSLVAMTTVVMLMIDVDLLGMLFGWGLELNSITSINLVMAIGLVVDYSAHIVHNFSLQSSQLSRNDRVVQTLTEIGPSVMLGVSTTFLGVAPLALSNSEVFRVFFKMFLGIVFFGAVHGLVLIPVLLSLVGKGGGAAQVSEVPE